MIREGADEKLQKGWQLKKPGKDKKTEKDNKMGQEKKKQAGNTQKIVTVTIVLIL